MIDINIITEWLREDDYLSMSVSPMGQLIIIETATGKEVDTITSFMIATLLPLSKKKISIELLSKYSSVTFKEVYSGGVINCLIMGDDSLMASAKGDNGDFVMLQAVANFIELERSKNGKTF